MEVISTVALPGRNGVSADSVAYRGHEKRWRTGFVIGHEFVGNILLVGSRVTNFKPGDHVVAPFTR